MTDQYYTVKSGDIIWDIAVKYYGPKGGPKWKEIAKVNNLTVVGKNAIIKPGQVLLIPDVPDTGEYTKKLTTTAEISYFALAPGTERKIIAGWKFNADNVKEYKLQWRQWKYGAWWLTEETVNQQRAEFTADDVAEKVKLVVKPISTTRKINGKDTSRWTCKWSTAELYNFIDNPPKIPPVPTLTCTGNTLTAEIANVGDIGAIYIQYRLYIDNSTLYKEGGADIRTKYWAVTIPNVATGHQYKIKVRGYKTYRNTSMAIWGDWSDFSSNVETAPGPTTINKIEAKTATSVYLEWTSIRSATSYDLEYTTNIDYFDKSNSTTTQTGITSAKYELTGMESGNQYFFRVRAVNSVGTSPWSSIVSVIIGRKPTPPTTWSSTTTATIGEPLNLYWVHNTEDNSKARSSILELYINGTPTTLPPIVHTDVDDSTAEDVKSYSIDTSQYANGTKIEWWVKTAGITGEYSDWSIKRTVMLYAYPTVSMNITDNTGTTIDTITKFPFYIFASPSLDTQTPIGYHLSIVAKEGYMSEDEYGDEKWISKGDAVYSKYFDVKDQLTVEFSAGNVDLENNISYDIICTVTVDNGLSGEGRFTRTVEWGDEEYTPFASVTVDPDNLSGYISPYCYNDNQECFDGVTLSVYRREFDGSFTEIAKDLENIEGRYVVDPHPSLDYARYRIVSKTKDTGAISYNDIPGYPVGETSIVIQWNDSWREFDAEDGDELSEQPMSTSMLKLPYNIDISDNHDPDVSLVKYIGRKRSVSYYGTQLGETSTWNAVIPKDDKDTLYALRRLAAWMGDVYVREPSGSGYWANIKVSFNQKHKDLTIPVTLSVTPVEGGM